MTNAEIIQYLKNIASITAVDGQLGPCEAKAIEQVRGKIGATEFDLCKALTAAEEKNYQIVPTGRFSDKVRNLEDMIFVSFADGDFAGPEKNEVLSFAKSIKVTQDQLAQILSESKRHVRLLRDVVKCPACKEEIPSNSKFCPKCGAKVQ